MKIPKILTGSARVFILMASECGYFGKDIGKNSKNERTPLHHAAQLGHWEIHLVVLDNVSDKILHENKKKIMYISLRYTVVQIIFDNNYAIIRTAF